jgi:hypothetical protein
LTESAPRRAPEEHERADADHARECGEQRARDDAAEAVAPCRDDDRRSLIMSHADTPFLADSTAINSQTNAKRRYRSLRERS